MKTMFDDDDEQRVAWAFIRSPLRDMGPPAPWKEVGLALILTVSSACGSSTADATLSGSGHANADDSENTENSDGSDGSDGSDDSENTENTENSENTENTENAENGDDSDDSDHSDDSDGSSELTFVPPPARLHRLTVEEYRNSVRDLLGVEPSSVDVLEPDDSVGGFKSIGAVRVAMSERAVESFEQASHQITQALFTNADARVKL
ncbi:MAG: DUF1587 domain-containing protein, partial [Nannocystaceae bacterium]